MVAMSVLARDTATRRIVHISEVPQGYDGAECAVCKAKLVTSNLNPGSRKVACYFRHEGSSGCSTMTALHLYAQQLIQEHGQLCFPPFSHVIPEKDSTGARRSLALNKDGYLARLTAVSLETPYPDSGYRADVSAIEVGGGAVYIEIKVHHEVDAPKQQALHAAGLDVVEIDLQSLVDQQGLTKEDITEAVITSAPRHWVSLHRFNAEIAELYEQLQAEITQFDNKAAAERKSTREQRSLSKKHWRDTHSAELELINQYLKHQKRREALRKFQSRCRELGRPEHAVYESLKKRYGSIPSIVNIPVKGELAFKAHRFYWQTLVFCRVIQTMHDSTKRKIAQLKQRNRRYFYGEETAWLSELPRITPDRVYEVLMEQHLSLTKISKTFQDLAGEPLQENYSKRPLSLQHVTVAEYKAIPKPVPVIRRYLNALTRSGILDPSGDTYFMQYQDRPDLLHPVKDYPALKEEGLKQYRSQD